MDAVVQLHRLYISLKDIPASQQWALLHLVLPSLAAAKGRLIETLLPTVSPKAGCHPDSEIAAFGALVLSELITCSNPMNVPEASIIPFPRPFLSAVMSRASLPQTNEQKKPFPHDGRDASLAAKPLPNSHTLVLSIPTFVPSCAALR